MYGWGFGMRGAACVQRPPCERTTRVACAYDACGRCVQRVRHARAVRVARACGACGACVRCVRRAWRLL